MQVIPTFGSYGGIVPFWGFGPGNDYVSRFAYFYDNRENNHAQEKMIVGQIPQELSLITSRQEDDVQDAITFWQKHAIFSSVEVGQEIIVLAPSLSQKLESLLRTGDRDALSIELNLINSLGRESYSSSVISRGKIDKLSSGSRYRVSESVYAVYRKLQEFSGEKRFGIARTPDILVSIRVDTENSPYPVITTETEVVFETSYVVKVSRWGYQRTRATLLVERRAILCTDDDISVEDNNSEQLSQVEIGKAPEKELLDHRLCGITDALYQCRGVQPPKHALDFRARYQKYRDSGLPRGVAKRRTLEDRRKANDRSFAWKVFRAAPEQIDAFRVRIAKLDRRVSVKSPQRRQQLRELSSLIKAWKVEYPELTIEVL